MVNCCNRDNLNNPCEDEGPTGPTGPAGTAGTAGQTGPTGAGIECDINNNLIAGGSTYTAGISNTIYGCDSGRNLSSYTFNNNTAIGRLCLDNPAVSGSSQSVAVGFRCSEQGSGSTVVSVGRNAGQTNQGTNAIAIGNSAGAINQGFFSVAMGTNAGQNTQGTFCVALGNESAQFSQQTQAVAIGAQAAENNQQTRAVAIGAEAGNDTQGAQSVAIGYLSGSYIQGSNCVAVGHEAGRTSQGANAVAIGYRAGQTSQAPNSICLNASGIGTNPATQGLYARPVRNITTGNSLYYDPTTYEITYDTAPSGASFTPAYTNIFVGSSPYLLPTLGDIAWSTQTEDTGDMAISGGTNIFFFTTGTYLFNFSVSGTLTASGTSFEITLLRDSPPATIAAAITAPTAPSGGISCLSAIYTINLGEQVRIFSNRTAGTGDFSISNPSFLRFSIIRIG